jgi:hypothetical protein
MQDSEWIRVSFSVQAYEYSESTTDLGDFMRSVTGEMAHGYHFSDALAALLGPGAPGTSSCHDIEAEGFLGAGVDQWRRRDLSGRRYVYIWADGIHSNVRIRATENRLTTLSVHWS